ITALLQQHGEDLKSEFKSSANMLSSKLDQMRQTLEEQAERVSSLELATEDLGQRVAGLEDSCAALREENAKLKDKVGDLESRSRQQNIRILGLPEDTENGRPTYFFSNLLCELFGKEVLPTPPELDRAHRSLAAKRPVGRPPRPVILCLHRYLTKDLIIQEARKRGKLDYKGVSLRIVEDYSPDVLAQRAEYKDIMVELYKWGLKPALLFPACLRITQSSGAKTFLGSVEEAQQFIKRLPKPQKHRQAAFP
uniref:L1 transposable element RRM domain-containing protein n=1 Tax=Poecilia formosa TaxID=48698 RepID=A0A087XXS5_POEFO